MKTYGLVLAMTLVSQAALPQTTPARLSPAQQVIERAQKAIEKQPNRYEPYNVLAMGLARRARETSDVIYYAQADKALEKSFHLEPDNFEGRKTQVWILLGKHEFAQALEAAQALNRRMPDDVLVYGLLTDANIELGNYKEALEAVQWMLDMRPGNVAAMTRAAYVREMIGYADGALEFMNWAYQRTSANEVEDRAWILTQIAHIQINTGKIDAAEKTLDQAFEVFPGYHYALANMAKVRTAQQRYDDAVELLRRRYAAAPHAENLYDLADAWERASHAGQAKAAFAEFEQKSRAEMNKADNSNRELIFYYADHARKPAEALQVARREIARRHDVHTLDAYAWALYVNGDYAEARKQIEKALAVGVREAQLFYHAGAIASKLNDRAAASRYLLQALDLNPAADLSKPANKMLALLEHR